MRRALLLTGVLGLVGCYGPKGSPEGTVESFYAACDNRKWSAMADMLAPETLKKFGNKDNAAAFFNDTYNYVKEIEATIDESLVVKEDKDAVVRFTCEATIREPKDVEPRQDNCSDTYAMKYYDGKWYIILPATQRIRTMM